MKFKYNQEMYGLQEDELSTFLKIFDVRITGCGLRDLNQKQTMQKLPIPQNRLIYMQEGHSEMQINNRSYLLQKGDMIFTKAYSVISATVGSEGCQFGYIYFHIEPVHLEHIFLKKIGIDNDVTFWRDDQDRLAFLFQRIIEESSKKQPGFLSLMQNLIHAMFVSMFRQHFNQATGNESKKLEDASQTIYIGKAADFIQRNIKGYITVEMVAQDIGITENYLYKIFKEVLDISPKAYIQKARLDYVAKMLRMTKSSIKDIALEMEFSSPNHLSSSFKKHYGMTPNEFRKQNKF